MRLTNSIRDNILTTEMDIRFYKKLEILKQELKSYLKEKLIQETEKLNKKYDCDFNSLMEDDYLNTDCEVRIMRTREDGKKDYSISLDQYFPRKSSEEIIVKEDKFTISNWEKKVKLKNKSDFFRKELSKILYSFNTDKELVSAVPYLKKYFNENTVSKSLLPVPIESINNINETFKSEVL